MFSHKYPEVILGLRIKERKERGGKTVQGERRKEHEMERVEKTDKEHKKTNKNDQDGENNQRDSRM